MGITFQVEQRALYAVVRVDGEPTLDEFLGFVVQMGVESKGWGQDRGMIDLRGVRSLHLFTEHYAVGEAVGRHLGHMRRIASVVPGDRLSRASEKTAQHAGVNLMVFTSEGEAMQWLSADKP